MTWLRNPRVFLAPGLLLILVAIGGRFTLEPSLTWRGA